MGTMAAGALHEDPLEACLPCEMVNNPEEYLGTNWKGRGASCQRRALEV